MDGGEGMKIQWGYMWSVLWALAIVGSAHHWATQYQMVGYFAAGALILRANTDLIIDAVTKKDHIRS
jgi:hypothetical protein